MCCYMRKAGYMFTGLKNTCERYSCLQRLCHKYSEVVVRIAATDYLHERHLGCVMIKAVCRVKTYVLPIYLLTKAISERIGPMDNCA